MNAEVLTEEELKQALQRIFKLSQTDPKFRALCLNDPAAAISLITGKTLPPEVRVHFLDSHTDA